MVQLEQHSASSLCRRDAATGCERSLNASVSSQTEANNHDSQLVQQFASDARLQALHVQVCTPIPASAMCVVFAAQRLPHLLCFFSAAAAGKSRLRLKAAARHEQQAVRGRRYFILVDLISFIFIYCVVCQPPILCR